MHDLESYRIDSTYVRGPDRVDRAIAWWKSLPYLVRVRIAIVGAFLAYASLAFLPAQLHRDWMPDVLGLKILASLLAVSLFLWARWRLTWGRVGR